MMRRVNQSNMKRAPAIMSRAPVAVSAMTKIVSPSYRPHFARKFVVVPFKDGLLVDGASGLQILQGKAMGVLVPDLIELMDGARTTAEIQAALITIPPEDVQAAISTLSECGLIEDGGCETAPAGWNAETFSYLQRYVGASSDIRNAQEAYAELQDRETLVVASSEGRIQADLLTSLLKKTGVKSVVRVSRTEFPWDAPTPESKPSPYGLMPLIVSVASGPLEDEWHLKLDDWCNEQGRPWLRVMLRESGEDLELGPYFYRAGGPCFRCSFPQLQPLASSSPCRVSAPIALHLHIGIVAAEIIYLSTRIGLPSRAAEVRRYDGDLQLVGSSRCIFVPGCARCRPATSALQDHSEAKIDTAVVFEDYIGRRFRDDSSASYKNTVGRGGAGNHLQGRRMSNCPAVNLSRELPRLDSPILDMGPANGPASIGTLTLDNVGPLLLMTAGVRRYGIRRVKRWGATGGNLGSVELFLIANRVEGLNPGTYFYEAADHALSLVERRRERIPLTDFVRRVQANWIGDIPDALVIFTGAFHRLREKYNAFGYRLTHLDAGAGISQMRLLASALKIPCHPMRHWPDDLIEDFLSLEPLDQIPTGVLPLCASSEQPSSVTTRPGVPASNRTMDQFIGLDAEEITRMVYRDGRMSESDLTLGEYAVPEELLAQHGGQKGRIVSLPVERVGGRLLDEVLTGRHSVRTYTVDPVSLAQLSTILGYAHRWDATEWRSGERGEEALKFTVLANNVEGLEPGVYAYEPVSRELISLRGALSDKESMSLYAQSEFAEAPVTVWISANLAAACSRAGSFGHRRLLIRAGAAGHRLWMASLALGMAGCLVAGVIPGAARRRLGMDGYTNASLLAFTAGHGSLHPRKLLGKQIVPATTARLTKEEA
jgi:SagB-type dehydrogenase family enzyme